MNLNNLIYYEFLFLDGVFGESRVHIQGSGSFLLTLISTRTKTVRMIHGFETSGADKVQK